MVGAAQKRITAWHAVLPSDATEILVRMIGKRFRAGVSEALTMESVNTFYKLIQILAKKKQQMDQPGFNLKKGITCIELVH